MSRIPFAIDGMDFDFVSSSDSGDLTLTGSPSTKVKKIPEDKGVYKNTLGISVSNFENDNVNNGSGAGVFISTSLKNKAETLFILREGDLAVISGAGTNKNPPPASLPFASSVEITDAKQTKIKGE